MFCPNCGSKIEDTDLFCGFCGERIAGELPEADAPERKSPGPAKIGGERREPPRSSFEESLSKAIRAAHAQTARPREEARKAEASKAQETNERYKRVKELDTDIFFLNSGIQLVKGALLWDSVYKRTLIQLKFRNLSDRTLKSFYIRCTAADESGGEQEELEFAYMDVDCESGGDFGQKRPLVVKSELIRQAWVLPVRAVWEDGTVTDYEENCCVSLEPQPFMAEVFDQDEFELFRRRMMVCNRPPETIRLPRELEYGIWQCACGELTKGESCGSCGLDKERLFYYSSRQVLDELAAKSAEERRMREERRARRKAELKMLGQTAFRKAKDMTRNRTDNR